mmetsp:Transcript_182/g.456  ORF Transcript_182/g.456 Transcript_182/m.456 type:complete len:108 (+) Transcript_182:705-1028(+)
MARRCSPGDRRTAAGDSLAPSLDRHDGDALRARHSARGSNPPPPPPPPRPGLAERRGAGELRGEERGDMARGSGEGPRPSSPSGDRPNAGDRAHGMSVSLMADESPE